MKFFTKTDESKLEKKSKPKSKEETAEVIEVTPEETIENADEKVSEVVTDQLIESVSGDEEAKRIIEIISNTKDGTLHPSINFEENITRRNTPQEYEPIIKQLQKRQRKEGIKIFTLDYPNLENEYDIEEIIADSYALGFIPYISTPQLHKVYSHTLKGSSKRLEPFHSERSRRKRNR